MARWQRHDLLGESTTCLDGTPAAFFFRPPLAPANSSTSFVIFLEGGGWCASPIDCVSRTASPYGSSLAYPADRTRNPGNGAGYFSDRAAALGREFAASNLVHVKYCDGASFSGAAAVPLRSKHTAVRFGPRRIVAQGESFSLRFSGRDIMQAVIAMLLEEPFGLRRATDVLLSGCSAGGLAALLNAERMHRQIADAGAPLARFKVLVFSGIFHAPDDSPYTAQMRNLHAFANLSAAVAPSCVGRSQQHVLEPWRCLLNLEPLEALPTHIPIFIEQSALDRWQTGCVLGAAPSEYELVGCSSGEWQPCLNFMQPLAPARARGGGRPGQCTAGQLRALDDFSRAFMRRMKRSPALRRRGCGAFLHGCHSHCPGRLDRFVIGRSTLEDAAVRWWRASMTAPAAAHTHVGCLTRWAEQASDTPPSRGATAPHTDTSTAPLIVAEGGKAMMGVKECTPVCSPLYPWPDERKKVAARSLTVERAIRGGTPSQELCRVAPTSCNDLRPAP